MLVASSDLFRGWRMWRWRQCWRPPSCRLARGRESVTLGASPLSTRGWSAPVGSPPTGATNSAKPSAQARAGGRPDRGRGPPRATKACSSCCPTAAGTSPARRIIARGSTSSPSPSSRPIVGGDAGGRPPAQRRGDARGRHPAYRRGRSAADRARSGGGRHPPRGGRFPGPAAGFDGRVSIDAESLVLLPDGGFFIGDEYGPYVYRFSATGRMLAAIRPPEAFIPQRKGRDHFASNNPGPGAAAPDPRNPEPAGRTIRVSRA